MSDIRLVVFQSGSPTHFHRLVCCSRVCTVVGTGVLRLDSSLLNPLLTRHGPCAPCCSLHDSNIFFPRCLHVAMHQQNDCLGHLSQTVELVVPSNTRHEGWGCAGCLILVTIVFNNRAEGLLGVSYTSDSICTFSLSSSCCRLCVQDVAGASPTHEKRTWRQITLERDGISIYQGVAAASHMTYPGFAELPKLNNRCA